MYVCMCIYLCVYTQTHVGGCIYVYTQIGLPVGINYKFSY